MGRARKKIQYMSGATPESATGCLFIPYYVDGKLRRKSFSWHYQGGCSRTHTEELLLAEQFIKENGL